MGKTPEMIGRVFGRLTVIDGPFVGHRKGNKYWSCICICGNKAFTNTNRLLSGETQSCGCINRERVSLWTRNHYGMRDNPRIYKAWLNMNARCKYKSVDAYRYYGERGISVCDEWSKSFSVFRDWAIASGYQPNLTLDRIDVNDDYGPSNCRWVDFQTQMNNMRSNVCITAFGETKTMANWARDPRCSVSYKVLRSRIYKRNYTSPEEAITTRSRIEKFNKAKEAPECQS